MIEYCKSNNGLCTKKFHADIVTKDIDYAKLHVGEIMTIENTNIEIQRVGKPCFEECPIENKPCELSRNVAFGRIVKNID